MAVSENRERSRRSFLRVLGLGGLAACPICAAALGGKPAFAAAEKAGDHGAPHWSYKGAGAPEHWGDLQPDFRICGLGLEQTPIDLNTSVSAGLGSVEPSFQAMPLRVVNNGHTIQVNCDAGSGTRINDKPYELLQFHYHHPSEHLLSGVRFDLECHFVHRSAAGELAVLGVFIRPGAHNPALDVIWNAMPSTEGPELKPGSTVRPADMLPRGRGYYRYFGSLTTPPCSEGVLWTVYKDPIEASSEQVRRFAALFPVNARPVMPLNRRFLLESSK